MSCDSEEMLRHSDAPCAYSDALPVLYCVTLCTWCFLHSLPLQNARFVFGTFTCGGALYGELVIGRRC